MTQKGAAIAFLVLIFGLVGTVITFDVIKNDRLNINGNNPRNNWKWEDDWNKDNPQPQQPQQQQPNKPNEPVKPDPLVKPQEQLTASSYQEALTLAEKHNMHVVVVFGADWCGWCKKLKNETLTDEKVKAVMKNFVYVYVDVDNDKSVSRKFGVSGIPAYVITNSKEATLKKGAGYKKAGEFISWLDETQKSTKGNYWWWPW